MKKPFYVLMISILIMFVSCDKDSNEPDPDDPEFPVEITTAADLDGTWEFVNFFYVKDITECIDVPDNRVWLLSFEFNSSTNECTITDKCKGIVTDKWNYTVQFGDPHISLTVQNPYTQAYQFFYLLYDGVGGLTMTMYASDGNYGILAVQKQ